MKCLTLITMILFATAALANPAPRGGGSDGGGNIYRGRPLESYAKTATDLPAYHLLVEKVIADIEAKFQADQTTRLDALASMLRDSFTSKIWYFVPGPLNQIPPDLLNSAVPTDQAALQGFDRVWVDENLWSMMTLEDQAKLLLHEAFMGLKILQFAPAVRECQASGGGHSCRPGNGEMSRPIELKSADYYDVQWLTIETSRNYAAIDAHEWVRRMSARFKFHRRFFDMPVMIPRSEIQSRLHASTATGYLPTFGFNLRGLDGTLSNDEALQYIRDHQEPCRISARIDGERLSLKIQSASETLDLRTELPEQNESYFEDAYHENRIPQRIPILIATHQPRPEGGFTMYNVWLSFDGFALTTVSAQEMLCESENCDGGGSYDVRNGAFYICSSNPKLFNALPGRPGAGLK